VEYPDGATVTVRLRGIDAPEIVSRTDPSRFGNVANAACLDRWGSLAAKYVTDALLGQTVDLVMDSAAERSAFGQPLAYVHVKGEDLNAKIVAQGYARVFTGATGGPRVKEYLRLQARAQAQAIGLWEC
jgi:micrococcal nuclease